MQAVVLYATAILKIVGWAVLTNTERLERKHNKMEILLTIFGIALFIGVSNKIKRLCYQYAGKQNLNKTTKENNG